MNNPNARITPSAVNFMKLADILETRYKSNASFAPTSPPCTILVVLGAGGSFSSGMPSWSELKEQIVKIAEACFKVPEDFIEEAWRRLGATVGIKPPHLDSASSRQQLLDIASVELLCSVACETDIVREKILQLFKQKYDHGNTEGSAGLRPQLGYELLAHFLKHRFIDHLITFNFDEVLDTALNNEVGSNGYDLILMDQQNRPQLRQVKPRLFKLHGTISLPQTLRFTHSDTGILPQNMIHMLDETLLVESTDNDPSLPSRKTHVISIGYSWQDRDFANWITSRREYLDGLTIVNLDERVPDLLQCLQRQGPASQQGPVSLQMISNQELSPSKMAISTDQLLWALWNELEKRFSPPKAIPYFPVSRHLILGHLFGPKSNSCASVPNEFMHHHTTEARLRAEIYLHLLKCKGMISISTMAHDPRIHGYYKKWRKAHPAQNIIIDSLEGLVSNKFADVKETYFATARTLEELTHQICGQSDFQGETVYEPRLNPDNGTLTLEPVSHDKFMRTHFQKIFDAFDVEIVPNISSASEWLFNAPTTLQTYLALQQYSQKVIEDEWTHLLVIAESGEWLFEDKFFRILEAKPIPRKILLLKASDEAIEGWQLRREIKKELKKREPRLPEGIRIIRAGLEWWEHNRHLTLAINENTGAFLGGIYIRRPLKSSRISPMYIEDKRDCAELFLTFLSYVRRLYDSKTDPNRHQLCSEVCQLAERVSIEDDLQPRLQNLKNKLNFFLKTDRP